MDIPRLTLIIGNYTAGGAERVICNMANYWAAKGWCIHLFTLSEADKPPFYPLHAAVIWQGLDLSERLGNPFIAVIRMAGRLRRLRLAIQQTSPHAVISFCDATNVITLMAMCGLSVPVIVAERSDPHQKELKNPWRLLRPWVYLQASCVVTQTQHALKYFSAPIRSYAKVIPNPVINPPENNLLHNQESSSHRGTVIMSMGRLVQEKGFDILLKAFAKISKKHMDCVLEIWGEGNMRGNLEKMIADMKLEEKVSLPGLTKTPYEKMRNADLFVLSSRYEGFPNVLCEAMASGMPVVSFNCHSGPSEIIRDGIDGILVAPEDVDALADALDRLLSDEQEMRRLADRAPEIIERFSMNKIMGKWTNLIIELSGIQGSVAKFL